jgi:energy-converting hydrogenase Eha subunit G
MTTMVVALVVIGSAAAGAVIGVGTLLYLIGKRINR